MNINQSGFPQFPQGGGGGGQGQPGTAGSFGLGGGMQNLQNLGGQQFPQGLQGQLQGRPGGLGGLGQGGAGLGQPQQQQQRMGGGGLGAGFQINLGGAAGGPGRMGVPGQQQPQQSQYGATGNGMQGMRLGAPGGLNPASYQSMPQQPAGGSMQQQGLPGRPGAPLSAIGNLGGPGAGNLAGFQQPQQQQQQQRVGGVGLGGGMAGGGLAGLPRGGAGIGGVGGASTYSNPPSGDLMSILNKAGGGMGRQEEGPPSFNAADFPSLSSAGQSGGRDSSQDGANETFAALVNSQKGLGGMMGTGAGGGAQGAPFGEEDFPALPGAGLGGSGGGGLGRQEGAAGAAQLHQLQQQMGVADQFENLGLQQQQQQQRLLQQQQQGVGVGVGVKQPPAAGASPSKPGTSGPDRFGLLGLLSVIRMTDPDVTTLALGTDLTTLGLNLNSPEALWKTFASPWADGAGKPEPDFRTPSCYLTPPPRLTPAYFGRFQPDTLFYIFYGMPGDEAQVYAADELSNRGWYYHKELKTWLTRAPNTEPLQKTDRFERGSFFLFDPSTWNVVSKENFTVTFEALERPSGLLKSVAGVNTGGGVAGVAPQGPLPVSAK